MGRRTIRNHFDAVVRQSNRWGNCRQNGNVDEAGGCTKEDGRGNGQDRPAVPDPRGQRPLPAALGRTEPLFGTSRVNPNGSTILPRGAD